MAALLEPLGRVVVAGNIGVSVFAKLDEVASCEWGGLGVSSFMLEQISTFRADCSVVLNIGEDHVDCYASAQAYLEAKLAVVRHARAGDLFVKRTWMIRVWRPSSRTGGV